MFYNFRQNNSGGRWRDPAIEVIVEADDEAHADFIAEQYCEVYFDGSGDCRCCGNRWSSHHNDDGKESPFLYGSVTIEEYFKDRSLYNFSEEKIPQIMIRYKNGTKVYYDNWGNETIDGEADPLKLELKNAK